MKQIFRLTWVLFMAISVQIYAQEVGEPAPDFKVELLGGGNFSLADYEGKVVVIYFFGNTCPDCRAVGPTIESAIYQKYKDDKGTLVAVGIDTWDSSSNESSVKGFKETTGITFPLAIKGGEVSSSYKSTYDRLMVIDTSGILVHKGLVPANNDINNTIAAIEEILMVTGVKNQIIDAPMVYPNPAKDILHISAGADVVSGITLFDLNGRKVRELFLLNQRAIKEFELDLHDFKPGIYFYTLKKEGIPVSGKLVIQ